MFEQFNFVPKPKLIHMASVKNCQKLICDYYAIKNKENETDKTDIQSISNTNIKPESTEPSINVNRLNEVQTLSPNFSKRKINFANLDRAAQITLRTHPAPVPVVHDNVKKLEENETDSPGVTVNSETLADETSPTQCCSNSKEVSSVFSQTSNANDNTSGWYIDTKPTESVANRYTVKTPTNENMINSTQMVENESTTSTTIREPAKPCKILKNRKTAAKRKGVKRKHPIDVELFEVPTYKQNGTEWKGYVLLISNINFINPENSRGGSDIDHNNLQKLFEDMGYFVVGHKDKTAQEMQQVIKNYCTNPDLKSVDIQVTIIMSHGNEKYNKTFVQGTDGKPVQLEWITSQFSNTKCIPLGEKPKIFIFQCCRGENKEELTDGSITHTKSPNLRANADILIAHSTAPNFVSYRHGKTGSRYIEAICKVFKVHAPNTDIEDLLKIVDHKLNSLKKGVRRLQTSTYENRGFKKCYLMYQSTRT